jgi:hypothetical protein
MDQVGFEPKTSAPITFAYDNYNNTAKVRFFEDMTGTITNRTIWIKFNYTFTEPLNEEIDYTQEGLKFKSNGTVILR